MQPSIISFETPNVTLEQAGGKGANLCYLTNKGFPVPPGFIITTAAYAAFVNENGLAPAITSLLDQINLIDLQSYEETSVQIRELFTKFTLPASLLESLRSAYNPLSRTAVAVRSSATAEDLPDVSFAGQQDTYLNIIGFQQLEEAVRNCWSSLWTARAISYRQRNQISHNALSLAVVVQKMVQSHVSGVTFTANPLNGKRNEMVINATLGLGEALVSGKVEADEYIVDTSDFHIISIITGKKAISIRSSASGGVLTQPEKSTTPALQENQILQLAHLCQQIQTSYGLPQDIEWALIDGDWHILQSRPITSLFPLPESASASPLRVYGSFGAVQGVVNPITPLGQQALLLFFAGGANLMGYSFDIKTQRTFQIAGERLWTDITPIIRSSVGRKIVPQILSFVEPGIREAVLQILKDPRLKALPGGMRLSSKIHLLRLLLPVGGNIFLNFSNPTKRRIASNQWIQQMIDREMERNLNVHGSARSKLKQRIENMHHLQKIIQSIFPRIGSLVATGMAGLNLCAQLINRIPTMSPQEKSENSRLYLEITRGLPHNVTTEMDLALWRAAQLIQSDPQSLQHFTQVTSRQLVEDYRSGQLPDISQYAVKDFMTRYQMRGLGEIDMGRERWMDNPLQVFQTLQSYILITDPEKAPDVIFQRGAEKAQQARQTIINKLSRQKHGWLKKRLAGKFINIYRAFGGMRETPKFTIIHLLGAVRLGLSQSGEELAVEGVIDSPDDLFFLQIAELEQLAGGENIDFKAIIRLRRETDEREKRRRQIPRLFLSDGHAFYDGISSNQETSPNQLMGAPVSPGVSEGLARIVLDPQKTALSPGEILVCPGTDPAWTPLFLAAAGLVMEVGGLMTHGAVVAREYGIPAVVGVSRVTERIRTGQKIRVNGTTGEVTILDE